MKRKESLLFILLLRIVMITPAAANAADAQKEAYDKMVEESVKEADEYVEQKQKEAVEQHAQQQREAEEQAREAARLKESEGENRTRPGIHIRSRPIDNTPLLSRYPCLRAGMLQGEMGRQRSRRQLPHQIDRLRPSADCMNGGSSYW